MVTNEKIFNQPLRLVPQYREYVWGGRNLRPDVPGPTAEAWIVYEHNHVSDGPHQGKTLGELAAAFPVPLLGQPAATQGSRFPLLIKILDCAEWLSVQVHPDDAQARRLEGAQHNGKTEAWHVLQAAPGASLLCGLQPGATVNGVADGVRDGKILEQIQRLDMHTGDSILIQAGMLHALGPGLMVYEVQQTSDITYRVYDWDRPASGSRPLHIDKSLEVINPVLQPRVVPPPHLAAGERASLVQCEYFHLQLLAAGKQPLRMNTGQHTFHALTALDGSTRVSGIGWESTLNAMETMIIPAVLGAYQLDAASDVHVLCSGIR